MKLFARLIEVLDSTNKTNKKVAALASYFEQAPPQDKVATIAILSHRRPPRPVNTTLLREWASELANIPLWLFEESYHIVGDLAETIALIIPNGSATTEKTLFQFLTEIKELKKKTDEDKKAYLIENWVNLGYYERFVFSKLITGSFRIGVSQKLMTRALAKATKLEEDLLAYKLMGNWDPFKISFQELVLEEKASDNYSRPYPFYLAYGIEDNEPAAIGDPEDFYFEHKWDGIRAQVIIRNNDLFVWSRGEELVTDKYPEFEKLLGVVPNGTVIDGEILVFKDDHIGSFNDLQTRIGRKTVSKNLLQNAPVVLRAYDLLEYNGQDIRNLKFSERRAKLEDVFQQVSRAELPLQLSQMYSFTNWHAAAEERALAREKQSEGLMLKRKDSPYQVGRKKGDWWKWKVDPMTIDAVLTYAMRGHGRRTNLFTDYTFALWNENRELVTFAKAYSGLTDKEFRKVDAWIKRNTLERFGPVRSVTPELVFEIAFEGVALSKRHKSGVATRFPRILRWRTDKKIEDANSLEDLKALINPVFINE